MIPRSWSNWLVGTLFVYLFALLAMLSYGLSHCLALPLDVMLKEGCHHRGKQKAANGKCRAARKAGRQCAAPTVRGGMYCALHNFPPPQND
jgi:hypothetical protein